MEKTKEQRKTPCYCVLPTNPYLQDTESCCRVQRDDGNSRVRVPYRQVSVVTCMNRKRRSRTASTAWLRCRRLVSRNAMHKEDMLLPCHAAPPPQPSKCDSRHYRPRHEKNRPSIPGGEPGGIKIDQRSGCRAPTENRRRCTSGGERPRRSSGTPCCSTWYACSGGT